MTAKTRTGYHGHTTHGADSGTSHERLNRRHRQPGRREGAMKQDSSPPNGTGEGMQPPMGIESPPAGAGALPAPAPEGGQTGEGPSSADDEAAQLDEEEGAQT